MTETKQKRKPRKYTDEFKQQLVNLYHSGKRRCDICRAAAKTLQAAKNGGRLPDFKTLHTEYKELTEKKDKLYQEYGKLKRK